MNIANYPEMVTSVVATGQTPDGKPALIPVSAGGGMVQAPSTGTIADFSGSSTGASQKVLDANTSRRYLVVQNISDTTMWLNFGATATADDSVQLLPGGSATFNGAWVPGDEVHLLCSTSGKKFVCKEGV